MKTGRSEAHVSRAHSAPKRPEASREAMRVLTRKRAWLTRSGHFRQHRANAPRSQKSRVRISAPRLELQRPPGVLRGYESTVAAMIATASSTQTIAQTATNNHPSGIGLMP
jgi:hypothetical protein